MNIQNEYDVIVVGGGHAGCEAASAAANMGSSVLLINADLFSFARMSCNPAVGGIAKGQIVREIDALGGQMGLVTDATTLQFRMLNRSKGPAMWSPRAQCDKIAFSLRWRKILETNCKLDIYADFAVSFLFENSKICGVRTNTGAIFKSQAVILTTGTFLNGRLFIGRTTFEGGRIGELSSHGLTEQLVSLGLKTGRMKTGTPPRIDISSVDTSKLTRQLGDENPERFSFMNIPSAVQASGKQMPCFVLHTNEKVHDILRSGFSESPLFTGMITGKGPRYCPSIEDKLRVFPDKTAHQLFLEPEGADTTEYYLQGFSSSLPLQVQLEALHQIHRDIENLFFAGQINGTTGYEEAAGQGLIAGINASLKVQGKEPFVLHRDSSYIGVLIDDLTTKGVDEPYRMFTSRAEFRILLRQDNADERLTALSHEIGLASDERYEMTMKKYEMRDKFLNFCQAVNLKADSVNEYLVSHGSSAISESKKISVSFVPRGTKGCASEMPLTKEIVESAEICIKYKGYIDREKEIADKIARLENLKIPEEFDFDKVSGLTIECRQKFKRYRPHTIAQASRISGVSPADISVLLVYFGR